MRRARRLFGVAGIALVVFGAARLLTQVPITSLLALAGWLVAAVVVHDGIVAPLVVMVGVALTRLPGRARRYVQSALITAVLVTVIAVPLILRRGSQPAAKAILQRDYAGGLGLLLGLIGAVAVLRYVARVARDRVRRSDGERPGADPTGSSTR
jgi:hypothetical protein